MPGRGTSMRWRHGRRSTNIEDRRVQTVPRGVKLGGGAVLLALLAAVLLGQDPLAVLSQVGGIDPGGTPAPRAPSAAENELYEFAAVVLADTEDTWHELFRRAGSRYPEPTLVTYTGATSSACGTGRAEAGPFYCPGDGTIYLDLGFVDELRRLGAPGDFAFAYVIAHEVGHHVQNVTGTAREVRAAQQRASQVDGNQLQVRMELQADCYAGIWAHHADRSRQILERGDIEEGLAAAASVGDDRLQRAAGRRVHRESWTHGSSEQRSGWFHRGYRSGSVQTCDTFAQRLGSR